MTEPRWLIQGVGFERCIVEGRLQVRRNGSARCRDFGAQPPKVTTKRLKPSFELVALHLQGRIGRHHESPWCPKARDPSPIRRHVPEAGRHGSVKPSMHTSFNGPDASCLNHHDSRWGENPSDSIEVLTREQPKRGSFFEGIAEVRKNDVESFVGVVEQLERVSDHQLQSRIIECPSVHRR